MGPPSLFKFDPNDPYVAKLYMFWDEKVLWDGEDEGLPLTPKLSFALWASVGWSVFPFIKCSFIIFLITVIISSPKILSESIIAIAALSLTEVKLSFMQRSNNLSRSSLFCR